MAKLSKLQRVRDAIFDVLGDAIAANVLTTQQLCNAIDEVGIDGSIRHAKGVATKVKDRIAEDTYTGKDDPGEWAPKAHAVIHCESGIPNGSYEPFIYDKWFEVSDKLGDMFVEHQNAAVIAVWDV